MRPGLLLRSLILVGLIVTVGAVARPQHSHVGASPRMLLRTPELEGRGSHPSPSAFKSRFHRSPPAPPDSFRRSRARTAGITFATPVYITSNANTQGAEPSIRVDRTDTNKRIWVTAPTGIGVQTGQGTGGDLVWVSDNDGANWAQPVATTVVGGGDSDVVPASGSQVYVTGLTLANVTLAASCNNGGTFSTNPVSTAGTIEDRQWLDAYSDSVKPAGAPDFLLDIGLSNLTGLGQNQRVVLYQVIAPSCAPPTGGPPLDTALPGCPLANDPTMVYPDCYQWPGNVAIDEASGDAYVTYNTLGNDSGGGPNSDKVVVARVDHGGSAGVPQANVHAFVAAANRPDTFDSFTAVAVDQAGNVYVVWSERHPNAGDPTLGETATMYAHSADDGATWSTPIQVNQGPKTTTFPWIVAGAAGKIDIVYYGTDATGPSPETVPGSSQWKVYMAQSLNATNGSPTFSEVAATGVMHQGSICTSGTGCASGTRDLLDYFQVDVDSQGLANIAYTDNFNTPSEGSDPHQEWVTFVQQNGGSTILGGATAVTLRSFTARRSVAGVELRWRTGSETLLAGFNVYRGGHRLNREVIRARAIQNGATYRYVDRRAGLTAAHLYRLQAVARDGSTSWVAAKTV